MATFRFILIALPCGNKTANDLICRFLVATTDIRTYNKAMILIARMLWRYRNEIALGVQFLAALRKTAKEATQEYIQRRVRQKLKRQIIAVTIQIALLLCSAYLTQRYPGLPTALLASAILWAITVFNLFELLVKTLPELHAVYQQLRGKIGFTLKYILEVSLVTELMQLNIVFLALCVGLGISTRTYVGSRFSYTKPWKELARPISQLRHNR